VGGYQEVAFRTAYLITGDASEAEEATQEAFVKAYRALGRFRSGARFRPWLLAIVANEARNQRRAAARRAGLFLRATREGTPENNPSSTEASVLAAERREELLEPLSGLRARFSGERIRLREAQARMDDALLLPRKPGLGKPREIYASGTSEKEGVMLVYRGGLPPLGDTGISLVLTEVPGDLAPAYLRGKTIIGSEFERVSVDGGPGYWRSAGNRLLGHVLLWKQGGVALRLEADVRKEQAIRIAESVR
jgi:RNA polymerase sigma factor (sigma-70 family)